MAGAALHKYLNGKAVLRCRQNLPILDFGRALIMSVEDDLFIKG